MPIELSPYSTVHWERSCQMYLSRQNSCPQWLINGITNNIVSFSTFPLKHRLYVAASIKHQVFGAAKATDVERMVTGNLPPQQPHSPREEMMVPAALCQVSHLTVRYS